MHPVFLEELEIHKQRLATFFEVKEQEKTENADMQMLKTYLEDLRESLMERDYDQADDIMNEINQYAYEETIGKKIACLAQQVMEIEAEAAIMTIDEMEHFFSNGN